MTRQMFTGIYVDSKEELIERIYKYVDELNAVPVLYEWKYKKDTIDPDKEDIRKIIYEVVNAKATSIENQGKTCA